MMGLARRTDPDTSHDAGRRAVEFTGTHAQQVVAALRVLGPATQSEVAKAVGLLPHQVNKRLADLHCAEEIAPTGDTRPGHAGREERVWRLWDDELDGTGWQQQAML